MFMGPEPPAADSVQKVGKPIPNQYIVVFSETAATVDYSTGRYEVDVAAKADELTAKYLVTVDRTWKHAIKGLVARMTPEQAEALAQDPDVALVEEDGVVTINTTQTGATWGLDRIHQRNLPLDGTYQYNLMGSGVTAYVIDTGIRTTHTEFGGRARAGFSAINDGNGANDCHGHGTHVSGTIGGITYGVAKTVNLVAVRVLDCNGSGYKSGVISGIDWVTQNKTLPAVANMSLGGSASTAEDIAVRNSIAAGITYAVAAGNSNDNACNYSPARVAEAITVGATDSADTRAYFSSYGTCLDIFAPGVNITSSWNTSNTAINTISGTSMATPHVAGAAALYLSGNPGATPSQVAVALTNNATPNKVVDPVGSVNKLLYTGLIQVPVPLGEALDNTSLTWATTGNAAWWGQSQTSNFGGSAAQSGTIADSQSSNLTTVVIGPATLTYYWKVSSESGYDFLALSVDGSQQFAISGEVDWQPITVAIPAGQHTLRWSYGKDGNVISGSDAGWVDKVVLTGGMPGSLLNDLVVDFGQPYGIYIWVNGTGFVAQLHSLSAQSITAVDFNADGHSDLVVDFGPSYGIYTWVSGTVPGTGQWVAQIHSLSAQSITAVDFNGDRKSDLAVDFGPSYGIYTWVSGTAPGTGQWVAQIHSLSARSITSFDYDNDGSSSDLVVDFGPLYGIYVWEAGTVPGIGQWVVQIHSLSAREIDAFKAD